MGNKTINFNSYILSYIKIHLKWTVDLNIKDKITKQTETSIWKAIKKWELHI